MSLVMRKTSKWWYARYKIDGKEFVKNLHVEIRGARPKDLSEKGSVYFENSRGEAQQAFDRLMAEVHSGKSETQLVEAVYEARAGKKLNRHTIDEFPALWLNKPRRRSLSSEHQKQTLAKLNSFVAYIKEHYPKVLRVDQLRTEHVSAFLDTLEQKGVTAETWNKYLVPIKTALRRAGVPAAREILSKEVETVYRQPFTVEELNAVLEAAQSDPLIYSLAITAACTAMRRKDCCFLKWESIDLNAGFITVKTSKTGEVVDIPMANMLEAEIRNQKRRKSEYVFPDAKALYETNPTALTHRFKAVLKKAGFDDGEDLPTNEYKTDDCTPEEIRKAATEVFHGEKLNYALALLDAYLAGNCIRTSAKAAGISISTASLYLNKLETHLEKAFIRGKIRVVKTKEIAKPTRGRMYEERETGILRASIRDFHSLRTTFVTIALMRGLPLDVVRKITGHRTVELVTKHYFRPERQQLREAMQKTLPDILNSSSDTKSPTEEALELMKTLNGNNWKTVKGKVIAILEAKK
ncbi:MAG: tyrosine-type recombinase/integrase [Kiritimatiellales bacterium]